MWGGQFVLIGRVLYNVEEKHANFPKNWVGAIAPPAPYAPPALRIL